MPSRRVRLDEQTRVDERPLDASARPSRPAGRRPCGARRDGRTAVRHRGGVRLRDRRRRRSRCRARPRRSARRSCSCPGRFPCSRPARARGHPAVASTSTTDARCILARSGEAGAVHERREADALLDRARRDWPRANARSLRVVVRQRQRAIEQQVHLDRLAHHLADRARLALRDEVAPAQLVRREPDGAGDDVHVALEREETLRRAESAKRAVRRRGRRHDTPANRARSDRSTGPAACIVPRDSTTGDSVQYAPPSSTKSMSIATQPAVAIDDGPVPRARRMPLRRRHHVFRAVVDELHRPAGLPREQRRVRRDQRRVLFLAAESAAGLHLDDAHLVRPAARTASTSALCT